MEAIQAAGDYSEFPGVRPACQAEAEHYNQRIMDSAPTAPVCGRVGVPIPRHRKLGVCGGQIPLQPIISPRDHYLLSPSMLPALIPLSPASYDDFGATCAVEMTPPPPVSSGKYCSPYNQSMSVFAEMRASLNQPTAAPRWTVYSDPAYSLPEDAQTSQHGQASLNQPTAAPRWNVYSDPAYSLPEDAQTSPNDVRRLNAHGEAPGSLILLPASRSASSLNVATSTNANSTCAPENESDSTEAGEATQCRCSTFHSYFSSTTPSRSLQASTWMAALEAKKLKTQKLACFFCRGRKIACVPIKKGRGGIGEGKKEIRAACSQCQDRGIECQYPARSRRGMWKKKE
ncbi:hypothetical protein B0H14DRAFT_3605953 [Mycena olivaceomarginata]|nr:hypothetical protein B0H14DRAFT_3605953 [Mycena olivaceomarginata]